MADSLKQPGQAGTEIYKEAVEAILREEIDLARPDDLAFLEFQVPHIARRIIDRLDLQDGRLLKTPPDPKGGKPKGKPEQKPRKKKPAK